MASATTGNGDGGGKQLSPDTRLAFLLDKKGDDAEGMAMEVEDTAAGGGGGRSVGQKGVKLETDRITQKVR